MRATFRVNGSAIEVLQRDDYYAFGLRKSALNDISAVSSENKYLYNGKELQEELEQYDYGARLYDPVIGRWNVVDALAEDYDNISPYIYVLNNPINYLDPDGMQVDENPVGFRSTVVDERGKVIKHVDDGDNSVYQIIDREKYDNNPSTGRVKIGTERQEIDYNKLIGQSLNPLLYDPNPIQLNSVSVTEKKPSSAWTAIGVGLAARTGSGWSLTGGDPEPVTKVALVIGMSAYSLYVIGSEVTKYYYDKQKEEEWNQRILAASEHTKGARPSTKGKHQKGQARKAADRGGEKGEKMAPRKRPGGWKGPWPPKNK